MLRVQNQTRRSPRDLDPASRFEESYLLSNAIKFTEDGAKIHLSLSQQGKEFARITEKLPAAEMQSREVNDFINDVKHEGPECLSPPRPKAQLGFGF